MNNTSKKLKVLTLGYDSSAVNSDSGLAERVREYGELVDKYAIITLGEKDKDVELSENTKAFSVKMGKGPLFFARLFGLKKVYKKSSELIKKEKYNIISVQDPFEMALVGWLLKKKFGVGLNIQDHGNFFGQTYWRDENIINFIRYYLGKFLIKRVDSVRVVSKRIEDGLVEKLKIKRDKIINVPIIIDIDNEKHNNEAEQNLKDDNNFVFLTIGRAVKQKNLKLLVSAFAKVAKECPNAILIIVGRGPEKEKIIKLSQKLELKDKIIFEEWTDDVCSYYRNADSYVLSSNYEGWGMVIIEAANFELPIVMTDVGCANEVIINNESGLVVPVNNEYDLANAMIKICNDENLRRRLGEKAKESIDNYPLKDKKKRLELYKKSWELALE